MAFGYNDIYIADNLASNSYSKISSYGRNEGITNQPYYLTGNTDSTSFQPTEVEVYQVIKL